MRVLPAILALPFACAAFGVSPARAGAPPVPALVTIVDPHVDDTFGPTGLVPGQDKLFFSTAADGSTKLWGSDGTAAGTQTVTSLNASISEGADANGTLYFVLGDRNGSFNQLWWSDGTAAGTRLFSATARPARLMGTSGAQLFFLDVDAADQRFPSSTNGTVAGTVALSAHQEYAGRVFAVGGSTLWVDGYASSAPVGVWKSDGTRSGTVLVKALDTYGLGAGVVNGKLIYSVTTSAGGVELWSTDGTSGGTANISGTNAFSRFNFESQQGAPVLNGFLYFWAETAATGLELWKTDATTAGTTLVVDLYPGPTGSGFPDDEPLIASRNAVYFTAQDGGASGDKIFRTDGTAAGTSLVINVGLPGQSGEGPVSKMSVVNDWLFFAASDGAVTGIHMWMSDGTTAGTTMLAGVFEHWHGTMLTAPRELTPWKESLYFVGDDGTNGYELWRIVAPPSFVKPPEPEVDAGSPRDGGSAPTGSDAADPANGAGSGDSGADGSDTSGCAVTRAAERQSDASAVFFAAAVGLVIARTRRGRRRAA